MYIIKIFYFLWPCFVANMVPPIVARYDCCEALNKPVDNGITLRGKRLFGGNKTWRGLVFGVGAAGLVGLLQFALEYFGLVEIKELNGIGAYLLFGVLSGLGALLGDIAESFIKRQFNIESGCPFIPFDWIDYLIGCIIFTFILMNWSTKDMIFIIAFGLVLNPLVNGIGYTLKLKKAFW